MLERLAIFLILFLTTPLAASEIRFEQAMASWLAGSDRDSLPLLAELAAEGDSLARILLAQIEVKDRGHSPYRAALKPSQARALFRRDAGYGGFSQTWLDVEAEAQNPLATALLSTRLPRPEEDLIKTLRGLGEVQATDYPIRVIALYGTEKQKKVLSESDLMLDELRPYLAHHMGQQEWRGEGIEALRHIAPFAADMISTDAEETVAIAGLLAHGITGDDAEPDNPWRGLVEEWVLTAPATQPISDLCREQCPNEVTGCGYMMLALSGGYYEVIRLDTPLESVISQEDFLASPRARLMTLRRAALAKHNANRGWLAREEEIREVSSCTADLVAETRAKYE